LVQISSPVAVGFFVCLQNRLEILAFSALFAGIHWRAHMRKSGAAGSSKSASENEQK